MTEATLSNAVLDTPAEVAAEIANIIRTRGDQWYDQGSWFGTMINDAGVSGLTVDAVRDMLKANEWKCGTTACVAGWAAILTAPTGYRIDSFSQRIISPGDDTGETAETIGRRVLYLSNSEADWLFDSSRNEDEVLDALDMIAAGMSIYSLVSEYDDDEYCDCGCMDYDEDEDDEDDEDEDEDEDEE